MNQISSFRRKHFFNLKYAKKDGSNNSFKSEQVEIINKYIKKFLDFEKKERLKIYENNEKTKDKLPKEIKESMNLYLNNNVNARWILPNGVLIIAHWNSWNGSRIMPWTIITDTEKPIVMGSTAIHIQCNTGGIVPGSYNAFWDWDSSQLKPGMCGTPGRPIYDTYFKTGLGLT